MDEWTTLFAVSSSVCVFACICVCVNVRVSVCVHVRVCPCVLKHEQEHSTYTRVCWALPWGHRENQLCKIPTLVS